MRRRIGAAVWALALTVGMYHTHCHSADGEAISRQLAQLRERAYLAPKATQAQLLALRPASAGWRAQDQAALLSLISTGYRHHSLESALRAAQDEEDIGRRLGDRAIIANGLLDKAFAYSTQQDHVQASKLIGMARALSESIDDLPLQAKALIVSGQDALQHGELRAGLDSIAQAVELARRSGQVAPQIMALRAHAFALNNEADDPVAALQVVDALLLAALSSPFAEPMVRARLTEYQVAYDAGQLERARAALAEGVILLRKLGLNEELSSYLIAQAELDIRSRQYQAALAQSREAHALARRHGRAYDEVTARISEGTALIYLGQLAAGRNVVEAAIAGWPDRSEFELAQLNYAQALYRMGDQDGAVKIYDTVSRRLQRATWMKQRYEVKRQESEDLARQIGLQRMELGYQKQLRLAWAVAAVLASLALVSGAILYRKLRQAHTRLSHSNAELYSSSMRDPLTRLGNRRFLSEYMARRPHGDAGPGVLVLMDIDHFKRINDSHGHQTGDEVLQQVAARLARLMRADDVLVRWGGEEFLAFLPGVDGAVIAERILHAISADPVATAKGPLAVSVSLGFAALPLLVNGEPVGWERLLSLADQALYLAKTSGRNCCFGLAPVACMDAGLLQAIEASLAAAHEQRQIQLVHLRGVAAGAAQVA